MSRVVVIGDANADLTVRLPIESGNRVQPPPPELSLGGTAANTAAALGRLDVATAFVGAVGTDAYGRYAANQLATAGVDVSGVAASPDEATALVVAVIDAAGERTLFGWPRRGAAHTLLTPAHVDSVAVESAAWLHTTGICLVESPSREAVLGAMAQARAAGVPVSFDLNLRIGFRAGRFEDGFLETIERAISRADVVLGSATDELAYLGDGWGAVARRLAGERTVVARLGAAGARAFRGGETFAAPALAVPVVSTLGAGDAFNAGFIAATVAGHDLPIALRWGSAVAALRIAGCAIDRPSLAACLA